MERTQLPPHKTATFVMQRWKAMYVSVNKAACTTVKWLVAELQDEDPARFHRSLSREVTRTMTIHRRHLWQKTPMAKRLPDDELAEISPDNGWFVFGVVRHPTARLFSAWQSKLLLREPWFLEQYGEEPWFPRPPETGADIVEEFLRFVRIVVQEPQQRIMRNRHFAPQRWMLAADKMPYTRIYKTSEMSNLLEEFEAHLRVQGYQGPPLKLLRANETPLKPISGLFTPEVLEASRVLYAGDFELFDYAEAMPTGVEQADAYDDAVVAEIGRLVERQERINDLALLAREYKERTRVPIAIAKPPAGSQPSPVRRLAWRAKRRIVNG